MGNVGSDARNDLATRHGLLRRIFRTKVHSQPLTSRLNSKSGETEFDASFVPNLLKAQNLDNIAEHIEQIKDWQITNGSLVKVNSTSGNSSVQSYPIAVSVRPTAFPRRCFEDAVSLQTAFNYLYANIAEEEEWLELVLAGLIQSDHFTRCLWEIWKTVKSEGIKQTIILGIFRSDYMLAVQGHCAGLGDAVIKQVEFNTYSVAGAVHAHRVAEMHRYLRHHRGDMTYSSPPNDNISMIVAALSDAHELYGQPVNVRADQTATLMVVQADNINIADERPIEYALWSRSPLVPMFRVEFGEPVLACTSLGEESELLYHHQGGALFEVSVVYMRAGYDEAEYTSESGKTARLHLERSRAIKCPNILTHLATFKKVQQALTMPGAVEQFVSPSDAVRIRKTFAAIYPLDTSEEGFEARRSVATMESARDYILKPSLEGGGHNVYGEDIPLHLSSLPEREWSKYILMEKIQSPKVSGCLMSFRGIYRGPVISELGVIGSVLWHRSTDPCAANKAQILTNKDAGWTFKTKASNINEMSVIKGYGCFDVPNFND